MALWLHGCGPRTASVVRFRSTTAANLPCTRRRIGSTRLAGFLAFLVALPVVPDCAKYLFVAANVCGMAKVIRRGARLARLWPARQMPDHVSNSVWCSLSPTGHPNRGIDRVFETVSVVGRGLVSIAEVHSIVARAHLAKSEPEMTSDRFGFSERHGFRHRGARARRLVTPATNQCPAGYPLLAEYASL
jgi:hypothetical protein